MQPASGSRRDQAQPAQPDRAPAEQQQRSKSNGDPFPPLQPVCGSVSLAMISDLSGHRERPAPCPAPAALHAGATAPPRAIGDGHETLPGQSTAVQAGTVPWAAARQHRVQLVHSAPIPTKGSSRQPAGVGDWILSPATVVSTQSRNRTRARPCNRNPLPPWRGPGNSMYRLVHRCGYTRQL